MSWWDKGNRIGSRFVLELPLRYTKPQLKQLDKTFRVANDMKNMLIGWYKKQLTEMTRSRRWRENQKVLQALYEEYGHEMEKLQRLDAKIKKAKEDAVKRDMVYTISPKQQKELKRLRTRTSVFRDNQAPLITIRNDMLTKYKFSQLCFEERIKVYRTSYKALVGSAVAQRIADSVWAIFEVYLFSSGKKVSFSRFGDFHSLEGKSNKANIIFDQEHMTLTIGQGKHKMTLRVKRSKRDLYGYEAEALSRRVCFCKIIRKAYPEGWRYFVQLVLEGDVPLKRLPGKGDLLHAAGKGRVGLDIGTQTLAYSADKDVGLVELAEGVQDIQKGLRRVNRAMDRSRRATNPGMFYANGRVIPRNRLSKELLNSRGQRKWVKSNNYKHLEILRRSLYRRQAALRKQKHRELANQLLAAGDTFYVEDMRWRALAKRAKKPRKNKKGKFLSSKRFGKSIANKSPASFLDILGKKVAAAGGSFQRINTWEAKASQFDHSTGKYNPKKLSKRWHIMEDGTKIQRDMYSAFLIQNTNKSLKSFNQGICNKRFPAFLAMHDAAIKRLEESNRSLPSSMGIHNRPKTV